MSKFGRMLETGVIGFSCEAHKLVVTFILRNKYWKVGKKQKTLHLRGEGCIEITKIIFNKNTRSSKWTIITLMTILRTQVNMKFIKKIVHGYHVPKIERNLGISQTAKKQ